MTGEIFGWICLLYWIFTGEKSLLIVAAVVFAVTAIVNYR